MVPELIISGIISKEDAINNKKYFIGLLSSEDEDIRRRAWDEVSKLIESGIITEEELMKYKGL
jgi:hypothetical protein